MDTRVTVIIVTLLAFAALGLMMSKSIKKMEATREKTKKKKGRTKNMPQSKNPGR